MHKESVARLKANKEVYDDLKDMSEVLKDFQKIFSKVTKNSQTKDKKLDVRNMDRGDKGNDEGIG